MNSESVTTWTEADEKVFEELSKRRDKFESMKRIAAKKAMDRHLIGFFSRNSEHVPQAMLQAVTEYGPELVKVLDEVGVKVPARPIDWTEVQWVCLTDGSVGVMIRGVIYVCYYGETRLVNQEDGLKYWIPSKTELGELLRQPLFEAWREKVRPTELGIRTLVKAHSPVWRDGWDHIGPTDLIDVPKPPTLDSNTSEE